MKKDYVCDAEFDSLTPNRLWCVVAKELDNPTNIEVFRYDKDTDFKQFERFSKQNVSRWIGHHFLSFDAPNLSKLVGSIQLNPEDVIDTLILSRLIDYKRQGGHSIENIGQFYGRKKEVVIEYDRPELIETYVSRCISDVEINHLVYVKEFRRFVEDPSWHKAIKLEHDLQIILNTQKENGFGFDKDRAEFLVDELTTRLGTLTNEIQKSVGTIKEIDKEVTFRRKKDGTPDKNTLNYISLGICKDTFNSGDTATLYKEREFNPASPKDRINLLNESGWEPIVKTKTHQKAEFEYKRKKWKLTEKEQQRWERLKTTGWQVCEDNLQTLPDDAPEGAKKLTEWLTLEARLSDLKEWLAHYNPTTASLHPTVTGIGAWTHRSSHNNPNCGNIFSVFHGEVKTPVDKIKNKYDGTLRSLWCAREDRVLIGTDAEGIQLRILAHLMDDEEYINAVANGRKEDETDVHNVNRRALRLTHLTRDHAKTFIYAWILGAGTGKVSQILETSKKNAKIATDSFISSYPGLLELKKTRIPREASRGYFDGLDGRKVICGNQHLVLAGHLQNGEKIIMAEANRIWQGELNKLKVPYWQVNFVHDEWQTETLPDYVDIVKETQCNSIVEAGVNLKLKCPLAGESKHGQNWMETH